MWLTLIVGFFLHVTAAFFLRLWQNKLDKKLKSDG